MLCPLTAAAAVPEDLQLDRAPDVLVRFDPVPNPHGKFPCKRCHTKSENSYAIAHRYGLSLPLITEGEDPILLCEQCHTDCHLFHPVKFPVKRLADAVARAGVFPLETPVEGLNKLTCTTCHNVHFSHTANRLLRGFPVDSRVGGAPFRTRLDFCRSCHGADETSRLSGHLSVASDKLCGLCHAARDIAGKIGALKGNLNAACSVCHPPPPGALPHFYDFNPFAGMRQEDVVGYGTALLQGRFTCATCHTYHRPTPETPSFKEGFTAAVAASVHVNPHRTTSFCINCHPVKPPPPGTPGALAPLVEEDITRLCRGCHTRGNALQMQHPLAPPTAKVPVPPEWPLGKGGSVGCQTCHLAGHGPRNPENPNFLRGGPYQTRNEPCSRCHSEDAVRRRNIHAEVAKSGGCDFCHEITQRTVLHPEGTAGPVLADPTFLCLLCHAAPPHPASANHTLRPRLLNFLSMDAKQTPLYTGKITCHTCHDSHGTVLGKNFLRTVDRIPVCDNCHPY